MISASMSGSRDPRHQQRFTPYEPQSLKAFLKTVTSDVWSPIVWRDGLRLKTHFESCAYIALDFDQGVTVAGIREELETLGVSYILATTKSHQKEKKTAAGKLLPACDRFRVVMPAEAPIRDRELYEYNMGVFAEMFGADGACVDAARFFYPCTEVVSHRLGQKVAWLPFGDDYEPEELRFERRREKYAALGRQGMLPSWVSNIFDGGEIVEVERHRTCYRVGCAFADLGLDPGIAVQKLLKTSVADIGEADVERAVMNGYERAGGT